MNRPEQNRDWRTELGAAAGRVEWDIVHHIAEAYAGHLAGLPEPDVDEVADVLTILLDNLRHDDVRLVADAALGQELRDAAIRRRYAQALVDAGSPSGALLVYEQVVRDHPDDVEARGGVGRCTKQLFVATTEPGRSGRYLGRSVTAYRDAYREQATRYWHGINTVALLARAQRDGIALRDVPEPATEAARIATDVLRTVSVAEPGPWEHATACEARLALGRHDAAVLDAARFVAHPDTNAFMLAAFLRQLVEIWQLDSGSPPGQALLPVLRSALLEKSDGRLVLDADTVETDKRAAARPTLERVLGTERYKGLTWYRTGLERCGAVARIETRFGDGIGTGFLVRGTDLRTDLPELVLLTNAHVIPESMYADQAVVSFHGLDGDARPVRVRRLIWHRESAESLDCAILELDGYPDEAAPVPIAKRLPALGGEAKQRAYVIGHPRGLESPQFSLQDNALLDWDERVLHYRSPTEEGSSGSVVLDGEWQAIGLHHSGSFETSRLHGKGGTYAANEAISLEAIRKALAADDTLKG